MDRQDLRFSPQVTHHTHAAIAQYPVPSGPVWAWPSSLGVEGLSPHWWH